MEAEISIKKSYSVLIQKKIKKLMLVFQKQSFRKSSGLENAFIYNAEFISIYGQLQIYGPLFSLINSS